MTEDVRVRFAPAPTGYMHIGNLHTALFNWLFARKMGGAMILRIEDTDELRSTSDALEVIYQGLKWIGLDWDEGPDVGGEYGPYVQSERLDIYHEYLDQLIGGERAYECFCTPEELEERRQVMRARGIPPKYDGRCAALSDDEREELRAAGRKSCIRFRVEEGGTTLIRDIIQGEVTYDNALIGDPVIVKTSGFPTYHFACVVDDHLMRITHVIRAVEHLPNTQIHMQLQAALGFEPPAYAHLPLILGEDRTKLSKRHGAVAVTDYEQQGFLPEAMFNFLVLLGWSPGDEREVMSREEILSSFSLEACDSSPSVFDVQKAEWMNGEYMKLMAPEVIAERLLPLLQEARLMEDSPSAERWEWLVQVVDLMRERTRLLTTFVSWGQYFFTDDYEYENRARKKWLSREEIPERLELLADRLQLLATWDHQSIETAVRGLAEESGVSAAKVIHPCRAAITGTTIGPSLFHLMELLDQEDAIGRLRGTAELARAGKLAAEPEDE